MHAGHHSRVLNLFHFTLTPSFWAVGGVVGRWAFTYKETEARMMSEGLSGTGSQHT